MTVRALHEARRFRASQSDAVAHAHVRQSPRVGVADVRGKLEAAEGPPAQANRRREPVRLTKEQLSRDKGRDQ